MRTVGTLVEHKFSEDSYFSIQNGEGQNFAFNNIKWLKSIHLTFGCKQTYTGIGMVKQELRITRVKKWCKKRFRKLFVKMAKSELKIEKAKQRKVWKLFDKNG